MTDNTTAPGGPRVNLLADCGNCFALCCVALPFAASADFAFDKAAGEPCRNLAEDFGCRIHAELRPSGFPGCTGYDCFGAGQQVSQVSFGGRDWRRHPGTAVQMFRLLPVMRQLHELLFLLEAALHLEPPEALGLALRTAHETTTHTVFQSPEVLLAFDVAGHRSGIGPLLLEASRLVRAGSPATDKVPLDHSHADLIGAVFAHTDLRAADFRGAYLIGADLRGADLRLADLLGADLRAADVRGANLSTAIFLTQFQLNVALGDAATQVPTSLARPGHWSAG